MHSHRPTGKSPKCTQNVCRVSGLHKKSPISIVPTSSGGPCADYQCKYRKLVQFFGTLALEQNSRFVRTLCANTEIVQSLSLVGRRVTLGSKVLRSLLNPLSTLCWLQELSHNLLQWELRRDEHRHQPRENVGRHTYSVVLKFFVERTDFTKSQMSTKKQLNIIVNNKQRD